MKNLILIFYGIFIIAIVFFSYLFVDVNLFYIKAVYTGFALGNSLVTSLLYAIIIAIFFLFYAYFLKTIKTKGSAYFLVMLCISSLLLLSYPAMLSYDIFNYLITSKVAYLYHENPYLVMPNEFINESSLIFTRATNKYALYGPVWIGFSAIPYYLGFRNFVFTFFFFKIFTGIFYFGSTYLIYKLSKENLFKTAFFAFNPLILIESFISGHNDAVMVFFALLSFYLLIIKKPGLSLFGLIVSILVKFSTLFLLPVWLYVFWKTISKKTINWDHIWLLAGISMFMVFLLSPIREEMYPWYAIWFIPFAALIKNNFIKVFVIVLSLGLMLRYIPFILLSTYEHPVPEIRITLTVVPIILLFIVYVIFKYKKKTWDF